MAAALWLWLCVGAVVNVGRADAAALRVARAEDKSVLKYYEPVFTGVAGRKGDLRWKLDEGRLGSSTETSICDCANACWDAADDTCDGIYYAAQTMECVLFKGLVGSNLMQRMEAEDVGTTSGSLKLRQSALPTADAIFRQCDTTSTSTYTTSTVTSSTSVTSTTQTTTVCETDTLTTMASIPAGYDLVHLGSLDPTYNIRFKKDIVSTLYQGKKDTLEECAHECTKLVGGVNSCEVHTSRGACFQEPGCFFDGGIGKSGGCRSARCEDHDTNPDACKKAASSGCSYAGGLCQSSKGDSDGARCLTTPTAECTSNATAGMHCERKDDRCDCQRGNSGDCISNEHRATKRQQMACEGFSYDICSSSCLVVSKVLSESQAGPSPDTVEAAGSPTLSFANSRVAPAPFRSADCRLFTHAHEACGVGAYCAKGGKCARCGGTSGAVCGGNGNTHDNGPCPAKCYGAELALAEGESWPAGLDQAAAAGAPQPRSTAEKCQIGGHKFLKKALENFVTFADGGDIGASTFTNRMDTALERLALRVKTTAPQRHLVVHRKGGSALYGEGRAADITMHSTDATVNSTDAELLAELSAAAVMSGFDSVHASSPSMVHVRVQPDECSIASDVSIVIDVSSAFSKSEFKAAVKAAADVAGMFHLGESAAASRVGVLSFAASATTHATVAQGVSSKFVESALQNVRFVGGAAVGTAAMQTVLDGIERTAPRAHVQRSVVVITTRRTAWPEAALNASARLQDLGVAVHIVELDTAIQGLWKQPAESAERVASKGLLFSGEASVTAMHAALCRDQEPHTLSLSAPVEMTLDRCRARTFVQPAACTPQKLVVNIEALARSVSVSVTTDSGDAVHINGHTAASSILVKKGARLIQTFSRNTSTSSRFAVSVSGNNQNEAEFIMNAWADVTGGKIADTVDVTDSDTGVGTRLISLPASKLNYSLLSQEYARVFGVSESGNVTLLKKLNATEQARYDVHFKVGACATFLLTVEVKEHVPTTTPVAASTTGSSSDDGGESSGSGSGIGSGSGSGSGGTTTTTTTTTTTSSTSVTIEGTPIATTPPATTAEGEGPGPVSTAESTVTTTTTATTETTTQPSAATTTTTATTTLQATSPPVVSTTNTSTSSPASTTNVTAAINSTVAPIENSDSGSGSGSDGDFLGPETTGVPALANVSNASGSLWALEFELNSPVAVASIEPSTEERLQMVLTQWVFSATSDDEELFEESRGMTLAGAAQRVRRSTQVYATLAMDQGVTEARADDVMNDCRRRIESGEKLNVIDGMEFTLLQVQLVSVSEDSFANNASEAVATTTTIFNSTAASTPVQGSQGSEAVGAEEEDAVVLYIAIIGAVVFVILCGIIYIVYNRKKQQSSRSIDAESAPPASSASATVVVSNKVYKPQKVFEPTPVLKGYTQDASLRGRPVVVAPFSQERDFMMLDKNDASPEDLPGPMEALMYANRYRNVLPNKHSRVLLKQLGDDVLTTYINANYVRAFDGTPDWYIASQGPKPETLFDFWRMVWEKNTEAIVMTTGITEGGRTKCAQYWPDQVATANSKPGTGMMECGDYTIINQSRKRVNNTYVLSQLEVQFNNAGQVEKRKVAHFWYDSWPDHGAPAQTEGVTDMLQAVCQYSEGGPQHPWIVHCSAGIGRTGTFIGTDIGMHLINTCGEATVREIIQQMREDRGGTVQTPVQAHFIHAALETYAADFNRKYGLITDDSTDVAIKMAKIGPVDIYDPKLKAKRTVECPADLELKVTVEGFDAPGIIRFTGHHATDFEIGNCVGVEFESAIGDMNGTAAGHQYFKCTDAFGSLVSCEDVSVDYGDKLKEATRVTLERGDLETPFGLHFQGASSASDAAEYGYGVYISSIDAVSVAGGTGLKKNNQVIGINGVSCIKFTLPDVVSEMGKAGHKVEIQVRENLALVNSFNRKKLVEDPVSDGESEYSDTDSIDGLFAHTDLMQASKSQRMYVTGDPMWLHEPTSRTETEMMLTKAHLQDGHFMVRRRYNETCFSLSVVVSRTITHHLVVEDDATGELVLDGEWQTQPAVGCTTLNEFMRQLANPDGVLDKGIWPVPLTHFVPKTAKAASDGPFTVPFRVRKAQAKRQAPAIKKEVKEDEAEDTAASALKTVQVWTGISRDDVDSMLIKSGPVEGAWLIRTTLKAGSYDLSVVHKRAPAHHLLEQDGTGKFLLNRQQYGDFTTIEDVVAELCVKPPATWPLTLSMDNQHTAMPFSVGETVSAPFSEDGKNYDGIIVDMLVGEGSEESVARVSWVGHLSDFDDLVPISSLKSATGETNPFFYLVGSPVEKLREDAKMSEKQLEEAKAERLRIMHEARTGASLTFKLLAERVRSNAEDLGLKIENKGFGNFITRVSKLAVDFHGYGGKLSPGMRVLHVNDTDVTKVVGKECRQVLQDVLKKVAQSNTLNGPYVVDISKQDIAANGGKVGLSFASVQNENGNYVTSTKGAAAKSGLLKEGLLISSINGQDVSNAPKDTVRQLLMSGDALHIVADEDLEGYARVLENHPQSHVIVKTTITEELMLRHGGKIGFGFVNTPNGVFVTRVAGAAAEVGTLAEGHQLLMINGTDVTEMDKAACMKLLKSSPSVELTSKQDPLGYFVVKLSKEQKRKAKLMAELPKEITLVVKLDTDGYKQHVESKEKTTKTKTKKEGNPPSSVETTKVEASSSEPPKVFQATITVADIEANQGKVGLGLVTLEKGVYLKKVNGPAAASGTLQVGQQLLKINDIDVGERTSKECSQVLAQCAGADLRITSQDAIATYTKLMQAKQDKKAGKKASGKGETAGAPELEVPKTGIDAEPYYHGPIDRKEAEGILGNSAPGTFLVRLSTRGDGSYAISALSDEHKIKHFKVTQSTTQAGQWELKSFNDGKMFANVPALVTHYKAALEEKNAGLSLRQPAPAPSAPPPPPARTPANDSQEQATYDVMAPNTEAQGGTRDITVNKGGGKLGISVCGPADAADPRVGIFVTKVKDNSPAMGIVPVHSRIFSIDGTSVASGTKAAALEVLKASTSDAVIFTVSATPDEAGYKTFEAGGAAVATAGQSNSNTKEVVINKGANKLGVSLAGPSGAGDTRVGIFVTKVRDESPCKGVIPAFSRIFAIDGNDISTKSKKDAVEVMKTVGAVVKITISATPDEAGYKAFEAASQGAPAPQTAEVPTYANVTPPSAASASEMHTVTIAADQIAASGKVGLKIINEAGANYIKSVSGAAKVTKKFAKGWKLISVNGVDVTTSGRKPCVAALKSEGPIEVVVLKDAKYEEILTLIEEAKASDKSSGKNSGKGSDKKGSDKSSGKSSGKKVAGQQKDASEITVQVNMPMGMSFDGDAGVGCYVTKFKPGSNAAATGKIVVGLRFVKVNGQTVESAGKKEITALIKASGGPCTLTFKNDVAGFSKFQKETEAKKAGQAPTAQNTGELVVNLAMPMGMSFDNSPEHGTFVTKTKPDSNAERSNIKPGMRFVTVNGVTVAGMTKKQVTDLLKASSGSCALTFVEDPQGYTAFTAYAEKKKQAKLAAASRAEAAQAPPLPVPPQPSTGAENPYADLGRLKLVKLCRDRGIDYQSIAKDASAMQKALLAHDSGGGPPPSLPAATPKAPTPQAPMPPAPSQTPTAAPANDSYDSMGRLQLIKECRTKGIDYKTAGKDIEALKALLRA